VAAEMASIAPHLCVSLIFHSSVMALEGILFASRQQKWLAWSYCFTTVFFTTLMHFARGWGIGLTGVWVALFSYQIFRFVQFGTGVIRGGLLRKGEEADQSKQAS
jgi:Na+-driven multidrug efflux pump